MLTFADSIPRNLYVHVPWCVKKCPYCDFNSHALNGMLPEAAYLGALFTDLDREIASRDTRPIDCIFIGGGTPSLLSPDAVGLLIDGIRARLAVAPECEITLEANPGTIEAGRFAAFRQAGVNRLSLGVQSFDDDLLRGIGRIHSGSKARAAAETAKAAGFESLNLDLMYALPGQTVAQSLADIDTAMGFEPTHISYYQLTLEPNTLFFRHPPKLPADDAAWQMASGGIERLRDRGYSRYEVSAFAQPGFQCRHNLNYWRFGDYLGIGAGAHGKLTDTLRGAVTRSLKQRHPRAYLEAAASAEFDLKREAIDESALPLEFMMNSLRLIDGFELDLFTARTGVALEKVEGAIREAEARELVSLVDDVVKPTALGLQFLDEALLLFAPAPPRISASGAQAPAVSPCATRRGRLI